MSSFLYDLERRRAGLGRLEEGHGPSAADGRRARSWTISPGHRLPRAACASAQTEAELIRVFLLIDVSASMTGGPLIEAQTAAEEFLSKCDFTTMEVGLISCFRAW